MNEEEYRRRMQLAQQQRAAAASQSQGRGQQDPNVSMRYGSNPQRTSYRINNNVYSRYRPTRPSSYRHKSLSQNDVLRALSQIRPAETYAELKQKQEKLRSKDSYAIRWYIEPYQKKIEEPERVKTHHDFMLDEVEYMNVDFKEEKKFKKSLATRFAHEISNIADNRIHKKEKKELRLRIISMQMAGMIQTTFRKVQKNQIVPISPAIAIYISHFIRFNGFECQLTAQNINKIKKEYMEFIKNASDDNEGEVQVSLATKEETGGDQPPEPEKMFGYGDHGPKDEDLESMATIAPDKFKIEGFNSSEDDPAVETKSVDYYYPKKMEDPPPIFDADDTDTKAQDRELELLHSFFPSNGVSGAINDAKNFLISHKFVNDESEIDVVRGPFIEYEKQVLENEEFGDNYDEPDIVYHKEKEDEEFNKIAELLPPKPDFPEGSNEAQRAAQAREETKRKPEDRLAYEKPSKELPCLIDVKPQKVISINQLLDEYVNKTTDTEPNDDRKSRKRQREDAEESKVDSQDEDAFMELDFQNSESQKKQRTSEDDPGLIEIHEDDTDTRKKAFKTYCEYKHKYEQLKERNNPNEIEDSKKIEYRLKRGLLVNTNKSSKFRKIFELFQKDKGTFLEKRRLLSMYQVIWGTGNWNVVNKENIEKSSKEVVKKAPIPNILEKESTTDFPTSIRSKLDDVMAKQKQKEEKVEKSEANGKFLDALTKSYSELNPEDRLELYDSDCLLKRKLILEYQWQKMDTLWFQENNTKLYSCMDKPAKDPEIEADIQKLVDCLSRFPEGDRNAAADGQRAANAGQGTGQTPRQISNGSANLFRLQN